MLGKVRQFAILGYDLIDLQQPS